MTLKNQDSPNINQVTLLQNLSQNVSQTKIYNTKLWNYSQENQKQDSGASSDV